MPNLLSDADRRTIYSYIELFNGLYLHLDLKIFAIGGTLLGAVRDADVIAWDDDVDYAMRACDLQQLGRQDVLRFINERGFMIYKKKGIKYDHIWHLVKTDAGIIQQSVGSLNHKGYIEMLAGRHQVLPENRICADIFGYQWHDGYFYLKRDGAFVQPISRHNVMSKFKQYLYGKTQVFSICNANDYLASTYGPDWITPKQCKPHRTKRIEVSVRSAYVIGVFDMLHSGHYNLLHRVSKRYERIVVGVCSDRLVSSTKSLHCMFNEQQRLDMISKLDIVNKALIYDDLDQSTNILRENIDVFVIPPDYGKFADHKFGLDLCDRIGTKIEIIDRTDGVDSTRLRQIING